MKQSFMVAEFVQPPPERIRGRPTRGGGSSPFAERDDFAHLRAGVASTRADDAVVGELLDDMGAPVRDARGDEERRIERRLQTHSVIQPSGGPVEVREQVLFLFQN